MGKKKLVPMFMAVRMIKAVKAEMRAQVQREVTQDSFPPRENSDAAGLVAEIDKIFGEVKAIKKRKAAAQEKTKTFSVNPSKQRRYTEDGLPIYTEEELGINNPKAGTTPLCPFDCDCCH
jgi:hypothetical protein